jgi:hypothetical protein
VLGLLAGRLNGHKGAAMLGAVAGLGYAVVGVGSRVLPELSPAALATDRAAYAVLLSGTVAFLLYATALQRGEIMTATGPMVVVQTVVPSIVGVTLLADVVRSGWELPALVGLGLALWGAVQLGRSGAASPTYPSRVG